MTIFSLLLLIIIIGWLCILTVWRLQGRDAIVHIFSAIERSVSNHANVKLISYLAVSFLGLVGISSLLVTQTGGKEAFFTEGISNNGENVGAYYDLLLGLPIVLLTSVIAILLAWNALRISSQQHRVEILTFALTLLESYQKSLAQILPRIELANKTLSDQLVHFTLNASKNDDYGKSGKLRQLDVESFGILAWKFSQRELLDYLIEGHKERSQSKKWDEFIHNCISNADKNFWNRIDINIYNALQTIIYSDNYATAACDLDQPKFNSSTATLYNIFSLLNSGYVSGIYNNELDAYEEDGYFKFHYYPEDEVEEESHDLRTLSEKLLAVIPTDRVFSIFDHDVYHVIHEEEAVFEVYNAFKLIRISGFDHYVILRKFLTPQLVDDLNTIYKEYNELLIELDRLLELFDGDMKSQADVMAKSIIERKIREKYELINPQFREMAGFLRAIVEMDSKIVIEGMRVDKSLNTAMIVSKEISYELGFSQKLIEFIRNPK